MRTTSISLLAAAALVLTACTTPPTINDAPPAVAAAKSPDDHRRLADFFESGARAYDAEATEHDRLAVEYRQGVGNVGRVEKGLSMAAHCRRLRDQFSAAAGEARALAQAHRDLAATAR